MLNPPVSYTTPFPTKTIGFLLRAFFGLYSIIVNVGGSTDPLFTAKSPPILSASIFDFSRIVTEKLASFPFASISSANLVAVK